jgi:hypothetical protein
MFPAGKSPHHLRPVTKKRLRHTQSITASADCIRDANRSFWTAGNGAQFRN